MKKHDKKPIGASIKLKTHLWMKVQPFSMGDVLDAFAEGRIDKLKEQIIPVVFPKDQEIY